MTKKQKGELKRHLISFAVTFISAFLAFIGMELAVDTLSSSDAIYALLAGGGMAGLRAVIKVLNEQLVLNK